MSNFTKKDPIHLVSSSAGKIVQRGEVFAENYKIWDYSLNSWIPYSNSITSLTGTFYGDGSSLTGIVASADVDWSNVSATGVFKGDGSGLSGIVASASVDWTNVSATGTFKGDGSGLTGVGHNSLTGLLNNDHPQYSLSSHTHNQYALTSSLSSYALTSSLSSYALTSSLSSYALTSSLSSYSLTSHTHNQYALTSHVHPYLPLSGGTVTGLTNFTNGLTSSYVLVPDGDIDNPTIRFTSPDNRTGLYKFGDYGIGMVGDGSIITFEKNTISANTANLYIQDIYADEIYGDSVSARLTMWTPSIYTNIFYYKDNNSDVEFNCENSYRYVFNGGGALFYGGLSSQSDSYFTGLSANTLSGNGNGIPHNSLSGLLNNDHPQYSLSSHAHNNYLPLSGGFLTGTLSAYGGLDLGGSELLNVDTIYTYLISSYGEAYSDIEITPVSPGVTRITRLYTAQTISAYGGLLLTNDNISGVNNLYANSITSSTLSAATYGTVHTNTINGQNSGNITIEPVAGITNIYSIYGIGSVTANNGLQTNLIRPVDLENDQLSISAKQSINIYTIESLNITTDNDINITTPTTNYNGDIAINGSLSASTLSGNGSGIPHNSLSGLLNNDHPQYSLSTHTHSYLPIGGGTLTGDLNLGNNDITNANTLNVTLSISSTDIYASNLHGANSNNLQIRSGAANKIISFDYGAGVEIKDQTLSANNGFQTNLIKPVDLDNDQLSISAKASINVNTQNLLNIITSGLSVTGNTIIQGSLSAQSISGSINSNGGFILENRTSDPVAPAVGRMWFRTDL